MYWYKRISQAQLARPATPPLLRDEYNPTDEYWKQDVRDAPYELSYLDVGHEPREEGSEPILWALLQSGDIVTAIDTGGITHSTAFKGQIRKWQGRFDPVSKVLSITSIDIDHINTEYLRPSATLVARLKKMFNPVQTYIFSSGKGKQKRLGWAGVSLDSDMSSVERMTDIPEGPGLSIVPNSPGKSPEEVKPKQSLPKPYNYKRRMRQKVRIPGTVPLTDPRVPLRSEQALPNSAAPQNPMTLTRI